MNGIEDEVIEKKDLSRPYFPRNAGEIGLYVDVDDAIPEDAHAYGSEQLMRIDMNDKLAEQLASRDLAKFKGELEKRGHFKGIILEEYRRGSTLAVTFDSVSDLVDLWKLHEGKQLSPLFQLLLVDKALMKALKVRKLTVRVRLWLDEFEACREEVKKMEKEAKRVNISTRARDLGLLQKVRQFQKAQSGKLQELRDAEASFDHHLSEFLLVVKRALPNNTNSVPNLKDFQASMKVAMGTQNHRHKTSGAAGGGMERVKKYFETLDLLRTLLAQVEVNIYQPLTLIPARCETAKQTELKRQMKATITEMTRLLKPTTSLNEVHFKEWEGKVLPRERTLFMGLISLVPLGAEKVTDVDQSLDEYVTGFPINIDGHK